MKKRKKLAKLQAVDAPRVFTSFIGAHLARMAAALDLPSCALTPTPYLRALSPACMTTRHVVVRKGSALGKTTALIFHTSGSPEAMCRADLGDRRFWYIDPRKAEGQPAVTISQQAHPPVGTPHVSSLRGNSAPSLAPVAGHADWLNPVVGG
jgi:hypothetical protein